MSQAIQSASERVRQADADADASQLAFAIGPEKFQEHFEKLAARALKRIEDEYDEADRSGAAPGNES